MSEDPFDRQLDPRAVEASDWCRRISEGALSPEDEAEFDGWMHADDENRLAFERATFVWRALDGRSTPPALVDMRMAALAAFNAPAMAPESEPASQWWKWSIAAAAAILLLIGGATLYRMTPTSYQTHSGERRIVMLDDGSRVSMDAASEFNVRYTGDRRRLDLVSGRARFYVAKDPLRPFSVTVGDKVVVATGTSFSIERLAHGKVDVVLYEGHVAVLEAATGKPVRASARPGAPPIDQKLAPGRELSLTAKGPVLLADADPMRSQSWESGQLSFEDERLDEVLERVNRYAGKPIRAGDARAAATPISGVYNADDPAAFVAGVTAIFPIESRETADAILLMSKSK